ncbi:hypothetical protein E2C01_029042 [Portunus trituberculatus]|uniref:Uncharacterized protein n=1 Tax=Portunus trituberculatus TaxID=210409 RepID=A0A5B7EQT9_PORTR|nr:hypothetical protein [Portunus trituberculatus]
MFSTAQRLYEAKMGCGGSKRGLRGDDTVGGRVGDASVRTSIFMIRNRHAFRKAGKEVEGGSSRMSAWLLNGLICVMCCNSTVIHLSLNDRAIPADGDGDSDGGEMGEGKLESSLLLQQTVASGWSAVFPRALPSAGTHKAKIPTRRSDGMGSEARGREAPGDETQYYPSLIDSRRPWEPQQHPQEELMM